MTAARSMEEKVGAALRSSSVVSSFTWAKPFERHLALEPSYLTFPKLHFLPVASDFLPPFSHFTSQSCLLLPFSPALSWLVIWPSFPAVLLS